MALLFIYCRINNPSEYFNRYMDADVLVAGENNVILKYKIISCIIILII